MDKNKCYGGLNWFRMIGAILVITIHTSPLLCFGELPDFILTRILARVAVPFFFMVTGFFVLQDLQWNGDGRKKWHRQLGKLGILYGVSFLLYVPIMIYSGYFGEDFTIIGFLKDILINGTFYHLWYLPAAITGVFLVGILLRYGKERVAVILSILLYFIGLLGDSYYGLTEKIDWLKKCYDGIFMISEYTRNGLFFAPVFLILGYALGKEMERGRQMSKRLAVIGCLCSISLMLGEGLILHTHDWQRHDSMYLTLPIVMVFLFSWVLHWKGGSGRRLSRMAMIVYIIHPAMIVAVRLAGKLTGLTHIVVEQSLVHFILVTIGSLIAAYILTMFRWNKKEKQEMHKRAWTEISIDNLRHNVREIQGVLSPQTKFMAVVKANGYGSGDIRIAGHLNKMGIDAFAVATLEEGIHLRKNGIRGMILILGYTEPERIREIERYRLTQTVTDYEYGMKLEAYKRRIHVHIKLDTGMHRLGESYDDLEHLVKLYRLKYLQVEGIYTHLCVADSMEPEDVAFTRQQIRHYYDAIDYLKRKGIEPGKTHIQSSYGVLNYPELTCDYARIGIAMYGVLSKLDDVKMSVDLRPVLTVKSKIAAIKCVKAGETVGYGRAYLAEEDKRIAVVTIGYADGIPRELSCGRGTVLVHGTEVEIVGRICMDQLMIDITDVNKVKVGDVVTIIGEDMHKRIHAESVAMESDTITNELLSRLGDRLERLYL
ncbi:MAG: serine racemase VanT catalytic subunit [Lachnospiraceae bacterium]|nr:serine racemase VanT catalytic subunit [Lachnospiraceae bacterium]